MRAGTLPFLLTDPGDTPTERLNARLNAFGLVTELSRGITEKTVSLSAG